MKKIKLWSFTTVKDEEDIIETFVRYNINVLDGMVILDNCSNDNTLEILKKLKDEGLNIIILEDESKYFDQVVIRNNLLNYVFKNTDAEFCFPIDADEFISSYKDGNPREIIEKLDENKLYTYKMENYILTKDNINKVLFNINNFENQRVTEEKDGYNYKCIISRKIYGIGISLNMGAHNISSKKPFEQELNNDLFLAHYPVRSKEQITNKVIAGRLNNSSLHSREEGLGFHQYEILDKIIENNELPDDLVLEISKYYSVKNKELKITSKKSPINTSFCKNLELKYSNKINTKKILSNTLKISETIIDRMRSNNLKIEKKYNIIKVKEKNYKDDISKKSIYINQLEQNINNTKKDIAKKGNYIKELEVENQKKEEYIKILEVENQKKEERINTLENELNGIYKSKSWKITKPLRRISKRK